MRATNAVFAVIQEGHLKTIKLYELNGARNAQKISNRAKITKKILLVACLRR